MGDAIDGAGRLVARTFGGEGRGGVIMTHSVSRLENQRQRKRGNKPPELSIPESQGRGGAFKGNRETRCVGGPTRGPRIKGGGGST